MYKSPGSGADVTYILFGEAKVEDVNQAAISAAAGMQQQFRGGAPGGRGGNGGGAADDEDEEAPGLEGDDAGGAGGGADASGVEEKDIELVVSQAGCSREKAIAALKKHDSDSVNAIMEVSSS